MRTLLLLTLLAAPEWQQLREKNGVRLEVRNPPGKQFEEVRVSVNVAPTPEKLCAWLWNATPEQDTMMLEQVLKESKDERLVYCQVRTPVVSNRDYTMRFTRSFDEQTNVCEIAFHSANEHGPPEKKGFVRIPSIEGMWLVEPDGAGSILKYIVYSEPGGWIAAWMAKNGLRDATFDWVLATVKLMKEQRP